MLHNPMTLFSARAPEFESQVNVVPSGSLECQQRAQ
jgi:hypothetical protein